LGYEGLLYFDFRVTTLAYISIFLDLYLKNNYKLSIKCWKHIIDFLFLQVFFNDYLLFPERINPFFETKFVKLSLGEHHENLNN